MTGVSNDHANDDETKVSEDIAEQQSAEEVATDLGMTLGAARVAQHRVLRALKESGDGLVDC